MFRNQFPAKNFSFPFLFKSLQSLARKNQSPEPHPSFTKFRFSSISECQKDPGELYPETPDLRDADKVLDELSTLKNESFNEIKYDQYKKKMESVILQLDKCSGMSELKEIHGFITRNGLDQNALLMPRLVIFCANSESGSLDYARALFKMSKNPSLFLYNTVIRGLVEKGFSMEALHFYDQLFEHGKVPDNFTFPSVLKACGCLNFIFKGKEVHGTVAKLGLEADVFTHNSLIMMYSKCGSMGSARRVFDMILSPGPDVVSWNSLIAGLNLNCCWDNAISVFREMEEMGIQPNQSTIVNALTACVKSGNVDFGRFIHEKLYRKSAKKDAIIETVLIDLYAQCGEIETARKLFDVMVERNVVSWNVMIAGYSRLSRLDDAIRLFHQMGEAGIKPNERTMAVLLSLCSRRKDFALGKWIHFLVEKNKLKLTLELGNALIEFNTRLGSLDIAEGLFQMMPKRDLFTWNTMIAGYSNRRYGTEALNLFREMKDLGVKPSKNTLVYVLLTCADLGAISIGREINEYIDSNNFELDPLLGTTLLDMYAKCGSVGEAQEVFNVLPEKSLFSWTTMIIGFAMHGYSKEALDLFLEMRRMKVEPDENIFIGILMACNYSGLIDEGYKYLDSMKRECNIEPNVEHYRHMVELLGRFGLLEQALGVVKEMHVQPNGSIWRALLGACRLNKNLTMAQRIGRFASSTQLKLDCAAFFIHLFDVFAYFGDWVNVEKVRRLVKATRLTTTLGSSVIELNGVIHEFLVRDTTHLSWEDISSVLNLLQSQLRYCNCMAAESQVFLGVEDER